MLQPTVRRTWAPRGQTPLLYCWDRRERWSVISALSLSPHGRRLGLYFQMFAQNIAHPQAEEFIAELLVHFPRGIILVWDRWMVHRAAARHLRERFPRRLQIEWLPPYAPDLNPDEQVWNRTKYTDLANYRAEDAATLARAVKTSLRRTRSRQGLLRSFFKHAKLSLFS